MRLRALIVASGAAIVGACTSAPAPTTTPAQADTAPSVLATGRVHVALVSICGAGTSDCPRGLLRRYSRDSRRHRGYLFATPDTLFVGGVGCGDAFAAPVAAAVAPARIRLTVDWPQHAAMLDCWGSVFGFARFDRPVFDMRRSVAVRIDDRAHHQVRHGRAWPAPDLATWAAGRGMRSV